MLTTLLISSAFCVPPFRQLKNARGKLTLLMHNLKITREKWVLRKKIVEICREMLTLSSQSLRFIRLFGFVVSQKAKICRECSNISFAILRICRKNTTPEQKYGKNWWKSYTSYHKRPKYAGKVLSRYSYFLKKFGSP